MHEDYLVLRNPSWLFSLKKKLQTKRYLSASEQMACANELARLNVENQSGGPFGAIVVEAASGALVGCGVNSVVTQGSLFHAETVAIWEAQCSQGAYDLGADPRKKFILVSSSAPCAMCSGAILWSGIRELVTGASTADVESIVGFDEGPIPAELEMEFNKRGIQWISGVMAGECREVLRLYASRDGEVYNGGKGFRARIGA